MIPLVSSRGFDASVRPARAITAAKTPLTVSPLMARLVERARAHAGVPFEILNSTLVPVLPEGGGELFRILETSEPARSRIAAALQTGRTAVIDLGESSYCLQPLRSGGASRMPAGLLAFRTPLVSAGRPPEADAETRSWSEFLRVAIEADLALGDQLHEERLQARRSCAVLRFIGQLGTIRSESELARAAVHAAAVWFDVDARLYRRDLAGDLTLHTGLPGVASVLPSGRLNPQILPDDLRSIRLTVHDERDGLGWADPEALLVPVPVDGGAPWVLAVGGVLPAEAQGILETVGRSLGGHLTRLRSAHGAAVRARGEAIMIGHAGSPEAIVEALLRGLVADTGAASGAVTEFDGGAARTLAAVGTGAPAGLPPDRPVLGAAYCAVPLALGAGRRAVLEVSVLPGAAFTDDAVIAVREAASIFQTFLAGARSPEQGDLPLDASSFVARIGEELERARRFDLGLSMLVVNVEGDVEDTRGVGAATMQQVAEGVRSALRGSDLLGLVGRGRIAALLLHTDLEGVSAVLARVRLRLETVLKASGMPALKLGRAVLSDDCMTASDLLFQANRDIEAVAAT